MQPNRRQVLAGGAAAAMAAPLAACDAQSTTDSGNDNTVNDLNQHQNNLTIQAHNQMLKDPACQYPAGQLITSTELRNLKERLLRLNEPTKLGWVYVFAPNTGQVIAEFPCIGKMTSPDSQMTASNGVYTGPSSNAGDRALAEVPLPQDDGSYGGSEGGAYFFTDTGVMVHLSADMPWIYADARLTFAGQASLSIPTGAHPTSQIQPTPVGPTR